MSSANKFLYFECLNGGFMYSFHTVHLQSYLTMILARSLSASYAFVQRIMYDNADIISLNSIFGVGTES